MSTEHLFAAFVREQLRNPVRPGAKQLQTLGAVLGETDPAALGARLRDLDDPEALPMRELLLFPDADMARKVERWLLEQQKKPEPLDAASVTAALEGARVLVLLTEDSPLELQLEMAEAAQLVARLHLKTPAPKAVRQAVEEAAQELGRPAWEDEAALAVLARCRRARLEWTESRERFMARLIKGLARGVPGQGTQEAGLALRLLEAVDWCAGFLPHAGEDIATALAQRRSDLLELLQQAGHEEKVRAQHNFETRRMLGVVERYVHPEDVRRELALLDDVARATGGLPLSPHSQVVHQNLDQVDEVKSVEDMQRLLGLLGGE